MKTIEERADEYVGHTKEIDEDVFISALRDAYIKGAEDQKEEDEKVRLKKSDDMTIEQVKREESFANWYLKNGKGTPTFSDAIEWERQKVYTDIYNILKEPLKLLIKIQNILQDKINK